LDKAVLSSVSGWSRLSRLVAPAGRRTRRVRPGCPWRSGRRAALHGAGDRPV